MEAHELREAIRQEILRDAATPMVALRELDTWSDEFLLAHWEAVHDVAAIASMVEEVA